MRILKKITILLSVVLLATAIVIGIQVGQMNTLGKEKADALQKVILLQADLAKTGQELKATQQSLYEQQTSFESLKEEETELNASLEEQKTAVGMLSTEKATLEAMLAEKQTELEVLTGERAVFEASLAVKKTELDALSAEKATLKTSLEAQKTTINTLYTNQVALENSLMEKQAALEVLTGERATVTTLLAEKQATLAQLKTTETQRSNLEGENAVMKTRAEKLSTDLMKLMLTFAEQQTAINALTGEKEALSMALTKARGDLVEASAQVRALTIEKDALTAAIANEDQKPDSSFVPAKPSLSLATIAAVPASFKISWTAADGTLRTQTAVPVTYQGYEGSYWLFVEPEALSAQALLTVTDNFMQYPGNFSIPAGQPLTDLMFQDAGNSLLQGALPIYAYDANGSVIAAFQLYISTVAQEPAAPKTPVPIELPATPAPTAEPEATATTVPIAVPPAIPTIAPIDLWAEITKDQVNFRSKPDATTSKTLITQLNKGDKLWVYLQELVGSDLWYRVTVKGTDGYVISEFVQLYSQEQSDAYQATLPTPVPEQTATPTDVPQPYQGYALTTTQVALYTGASAKDESIMATLPQNTLVYIWGQTYVEGVTWDHVDVMSSEQSGYIIDNTLRRIGTGHG